MQLLLVCTSTALRASYSPPPPSFFYHRSSSTHRELPPRLKGPFKRPNVPDSARRTGPAVPLRPLEVGDIVSYPLVLQAEELLRRAAVLSPSRLVQALGASPAGIAAVSSAMARAGIAMRAAAATRSLSLSLSAASSSSSSAAGNASVISPAQHPIFRAMFSVARVVRGNLVVRSDLLFSPHWTVRVASARLQAMSAARHEGGSSAAGSRAKAACECVIIGVATHAEIALRRVLVSSHAAPQSSPLHSFFSSFPVVSPCATCSG